MGKKFDPINDIINIGYKPEERGLYKKMRSASKLYIVAQLKSLASQTGDGKNKEWFVKLESKLVNKKVEDCQRDVAKLQFGENHVLHEPKLIIPWMSHSVAWIL